MLRNSHVNTNSLCTACAGQNSQREVPNLMCLCSRRNYLAEWFNIKWIFGDYLAKRSCLHIIASEQGDFAIKPWAIFEQAHRFWILMPTFSSSPLWCWHQVNKPADNDVQLLQKIASPHLLPFTLNASTSYSFIWWIWNVDQGKVRKCRLQAPQCFPM